MFPATPGFHFHLQGVGNENGLHRNILERLQLQTGGFLRHDVALGIFPIAESITLGGPCLQFHPQFVAVVALVEHLAARSLRGHRGRYVMRIGIEIGHDKGLSVHHTSGLHAARIERVSGFAVFGVEHAPLGKRIALLDGIGLQIQGIAVIDLPDVHGSERTFSDTHLPYRRRTLGHQGEGVAQRRKTGIDRGVGLYLQVQAAVLGAGVLPGVFPLHKAVSIGRFRRQQGIRTRCIQALPLHLAGLGGQAHGLNVPAAFAEYGNPRHILQYFHLAGIFFRNLVDIQTAPHAPIEKFITGLGLGLQNGGIEMGVHARTAYRSVCFRLRRKAYFMLLQREQRPVPPIPALFDRKHQRILPHGIRKSVVDADPGHKIVVVERSGTKRYMGTERIDARALQRSGPCGNGFQCNIVFFDGKPGGIGQVFRQAAFFQHRKRIVFIFPSVLIRFPVQELVASVGLGLQDNRGIAVGCGITASARKDTGIHDIGRHRNRMVFLRKDRRKDTPFLRRERIDRVLAHRIPAFHPRHEPAIGLRRGGYPHSAFGFIQTASAHASQIGLLRGNRNAHLFALELGGNPHILHDIELIVLVLRKQHALRIITVECITLIGRSFQLYPRVMGERIFSR